MGERDAIIGAFPGLEDDPHFEITSPCDEKYNCIAWAYALFQDRWMQFFTPPRLDGVWYWWPKGVAISPHISAYIEAFKTRGFDVCNTDKVEENFVKVALYVNPDDLTCLHAARQKTDGTWMSKLGQNVDIKHGSPYSLEGEAYGKVHTIMKAPR